MRLVARKSWRVWLKAWRCGTDPGIATPEILCWMQTAGHHLAARCLDGQTDGGTPALLTLFRDERVISLNECRSNGDEKERNQNEYHEGRNHLNSGLGGLLFGPLTAGGAQRVGVHAQSLSHARAEAVGLDERADERANVIDAGAVDEIAEGFSTGLASAHLEIDEVTFVAEIGRGVMQVLADTHQGLVERQSGLDADYGEVKSVGQGDADALLTVFDHALQEKAGKEETERRHADQQAQTGKTGEKYDTGKAQKCQQQAGTEVVAGVARLAKSGLDQPTAGAGDVGGRQRDGLAQRI